MKTRIDFTKTSPQVLRALFAMNAPIEASGLEPALLELVKMRASQINGCAYCLDMHTKDARAAGETEQRLYLLDAWRETGLYTDRERAALAWTEAVTRVTEGHVPDDVYAEGDSAKERCTLIHARPAGMNVRRWECANSSVKPEVLPVRP